MHAAPRLMAFLSRVAPWSRRRAGAPGRKIFLHIGPHRTGTTTIQHTMRKSADLAPEGVRFLWQRHEAVAPLARTLRRIKDEGDARGALRRIRRFAADIAEEVRDSRVVILCEEDLLGPLPLRAAARGLYPFVHLTLPALVKGFTAYGAEVTISWQHRDFADWLESTYHRRHDFDPKRPFVLRRVIRNNKLPADWAEFEDRLQAAADGAIVVRLSFEEDAAAGRMGQGLFRLAGLTDEQINMLRHASPKHYSPLRRTRARYKKPGADTVD